MMKYVYHVAIIDTATNQVEFVTNINGTLEAGKAAAKFPRQIADGILYDLIRNGYNAIIVKAPEHYDLSN